MTDTVYIYCVLDSGNNLVYFVRRNVSSVVENYLANPRSTV